MYIHANICSHCKAPALSDDLAFKNKYYNTVRKSTFVCSISFCAKHVIYSASIVTFTKKVVSHSQTS